MRQSKQTLMSAISSVGPQFGGFGVVSPSFWLLALPLTPLRAFSCCVGLGVNAGLLAEEADPAGVGVAGVLSPSSSFSSFRVCLLWSAGGQRERVPYRPSDECPSSAFLYAEGLRSLRIVSGIFIKN